SAFRIAQTITVPAADTLTGVRFPFLTCNSPAASNQLTVRIQGVVAGSGLPDDSQVITTTTVTIVNGTNQLISLPPAPGLALGAGGQLAVVLSSTGSCSMANVATLDLYPGGAAYSASAPSQTWGRTSADFAVTAEYATNLPAGPTGPPNFVVGGGTRFAQ